MNCDEIFESLSEFVDEELSAKACNEINKHLEGCKNCRIVVNTLRKTVTLYQTMPKKEMPGEVRLRLHRVIDLNP